MILFLEDWSKYPHAIAHTTTTNKTWVRLAGLLKTMGIKNHLFHLALHNRELEFIDPYSDSITTEQAIAISQECRENPWYFFREVVSLSAQGSTDRAPMRANRANISLWWLFFNHLTTLVQLPRQTGKSSSIFALFAYLFGIGTVNTSIHLLTKDDGLRVKSVGDIKNILEDLPWYLRLKSRKDTYNTEMLTLDRLGNKLFTSVAQASVKAANNIGRGLTVSIHAVDEFHFIKNNEISIPVLLASASAARDSSKASGAYYGNLFASTAGYLSSSEGRFGYKLYQECLRWNERLFDCLNEDDLNDVVKKNSPSGKNYILCEYNHRQLGYTDEWLKGKILDAMADGVRVEAEFLGHWGEGNEESPISKDILKVINNSKVQDPITTISTYGYIIRWYVKQEEVDNKLSNRLLVVGLDTSDAIGNDDIAMCIRDVKTGEVVGCGLYNETNLITFANWLVDFLVEYPNTILIPERKSSGVVIIDNLLLLLPTKGINPFRRIFNWVVNDSETNSEYKEILVRMGYKIDDVVLNKYRKSFGYATSSTGRSSRDNLYGLAFTSSIKYTCKTIRDTTLITQLNGLIRKNDRIDHGQGEHDDMVISWMLCYWFLTQAKNLIYYGISPKFILQSVSEAIIEEEGGKDVIIERNKQEKIIQEIEKIIDMMSVEKSSVKYDIMVNRIKYLTKDLNDSNKNKFNLESILTNIKSKKQLTADRDNVRLISKFLY